MSKTNSGNTSTVSQIPEENTSEELCNLPCVGPETAEILQNNGFQSFADILKSTPMELHGSCNMVLSSSTQVICAAVDELPIVCPECGADELGPIWQAKNQSLEYAETESVLFCNKCFWDGILEEAAVDVN